MRHSHRPKPTNPDPLKNTQFEARIFKWRVGFAIFFIIIAFSILIIRYGYLQIFEHQNYKTLAENNRIKLQAISPPRGYIYDRNGILLADNRPIFTAILNPQEITDIDTTLLHLTPIFKLSVEDIQRFKNRLKNAHPYEAIALKLNLSEADIAN